MLGLYDHALLQQAADARANFEAYHTVGGKKRFGLVVDPGAASGLGGTDTKVEYDEHRVPYCDDCDIVPNNGSFSGIDGEPVKSLGTLRQLAKVSRLMIRWHGDLIGQNGSYCPFLLPLPPLIEHRCFLLHGMFDNGDGIMMFFPNKDDSSDLHLARVLYTDSGHYLLPTDSPDSQVDEEKGLAATVMDAFQQVVLSLEKLAGHGSSRSASSGKRTTVSHDGTQQLLWGSL